MLKCLKPTWKNTLLGLSKKSIPTNHPYNLAEKPSLKKINVKDLFGYKSVSFKIKYLGLPFSFKV